MKIGPVHVLRDATFRRLHALQNLWHQFSAALAAEAGNGNSLAEQVLDQTHGLMHSPLCARTAPPAFTDPAPPTDAELCAAERVVAAYRRATSDRAAPPAPSMWDRIGKEKRDFLGGLERGDVRSVQHALARMFTTELTWGLGQVHPSHVDLMRTDPHSHVAVRFTDTLVNLAEAVGTSGITHMIQDAAAHLQPLNRPLEPLADAVAARLGFAPSFPRVGSAFGFQLGERVLTIDSLTHAYNAHRIKQLGGRESVVEVGGGYGCLALLAHRAGLKDYAIFDLPWVNALQGYFLLRSLPAGTVRLYGESEGTLRVLPYWKLDDEPAKSCGVAVNTDSLPEMGRDTARAYLPKIARVARRAFLSVNQEARAYVPGVGPQQCVSELADEVGGFEVVSRQRYWMRQGYAEEVYRPVKVPAPNARPEIFEARVSVDVTGGRVGEIHPA